MDSVATVIETCGGPARVAMHLGVTTQAVCFWRAGKRELPVRFAAPLESLSGGKVRRWDLRPDDWHRIWPELIGAEGAPAVPVAAEADHAS